MPRIPTSLIRKAQAIDPCLPALLAPCRDLHAAQNELRWLREHVDKVAKARRARGDELSKASLLRELVKKRASGSPLQYLLGSEYFGDLEIRCRPGVLIPRADTAASVTHLFGLLRNAENLPPELRVLDLCTGTGCIPLLAQHELYSTRHDIDLRVLGVDVSDKALKLARHNLNRVRNRKQYVHKGNVDFMKADILIDPFADQMDALARSLKNALNHKRLPSFWDVLISNPPYISPSAYWKTTTRSVRGFEPKLALVPPSTAKQTDTEQGDRFYPRLLNIARDIEAKVVLLEVADLDQAIRVAQRAQSLDIFDGIEIWRDQPDRTEFSTVENDIPVIGEGNARSVLCYRGLGTSWLDKTSTTIMFSSEDDAQRLFWSKTGAHALDSTRKNGDTSQLEPRFDFDAPSVYYSASHLPFARLYTDPKWGDRYLSKEPHPASDDTKTSSASSVKILDEKTGKNGGTPKKPS